MRRFLLPFALLLSVSLAAQVPSYVPTDGLVAWYPFNGNADDASMNGQNGSMSNVTFTTGASGESNEAAHFNGDAQVLIPHNSLWNASSYTLTALYRWQNNPSATPNGNSLLMSKREPSGWGSSFEHSPGGGLSWTIGSNGGAGISTAIPQNTWAHITWVFTPSTIQFYLDGQLVNTASSPGAMNSSSLPVSIGMRGNGWHELIGDIDHIGYWSRALTESEVLDLHAMELTPPEGCTDPTACNYDSAAEVDDGSCIAPCVQGCMDSEACNYNPNANEDDGSCAEGFSLNLSDTTVCAGDTLAFFVANTSSSLLPYAKSTGNNEWFVSVGASGNGSEASPFGTIQAAINQASNGDVVTILPGTYTGTGNRNLSPLGKSITIQSAEGPEVTIIDCEHLDRGFIANSGESMNTIIQGLHITRGLPTSSPTNYGTAFFVEDNSGLLIQHCIISECKRTGDVPGTAIQFGDTETSGPQSGVESCVFKNNLGGGISASKKSFYCHNSLFMDNSGIHHGNGHVANPAQEYRNCSWFRNVGSSYILRLDHGKRAENCLFIDNTAPTNAITYLGTNWSGLNTIDHCTFFNNSGVYYSSSWYDHKGDVRSCILYNGGPARHHVSGNQSIVNFYFSLGEGISGNGNISGDPLFVDADNLDFSLSTGSPCIGAGENGTNMGCDLSLLPEWMIPMAAGSEVASESEDTITWQNGSTQDTLMVVADESITITATSGDSGCSQSVIITVAELECGDPEATNYAPEASCTGGACTYDGCMDPEACNYSAIAEADDGSCDYSCCPGPGCCGTGTTWDAYLATCVVDAPDAVDAACTLMNLQELANGYAALVEQNATLDSLLSACEGNGAAEASGPCAGQDHVTYHGHDYAIVEIGDQCWFAENLKTTSYSDGSSIDATSAVPFNNDPSNTDNYGLLYAGDAIFNGLGICPTSWHLGSFTEWQELMDFATENGFNGNEAVALKSTNGWASASNGVDAFGFNAKPAGYHYTPYHPYWGEFAHLLTNGYWWTSTSYSTGRSYAWAFSTELEYLTPHYAHTNGMSVRCVKD